MNANTPEEVAKCLLSSGGIANARIQLGDIIRPKDDLKVKDVMKIFEGGINLSSGTIK